MKSRWALIKHIQQVERTQWWCSSICCWRNLDGLRNYTFFKNKNLSTLRTKQLSTRYLTLYIYFQFSENNNCTTQQTLLESRRYQSTFSQKDKNHYLFSLMLSLRSLVLLRFNFQKLKKTK